MQKEEKDVEEASIALIPVKEHGREECVEAKQKELKAFEDFEVEDQGQERLSSRGFEETVVVQADSPTRCKELLRRHKGLEDQEWGCEERILARRKA